MILKKKRVLPIRFFPGHLCVTYLLYHLICLIFQVPPSVPQTIVVLIFGAAPDFDMVYLQIIFLFKKNIPPEKRTQHHTFPGHYPLLYAPTGLLFLFSIILPYILPFHFVLAINIVLFSHFLLDTICIPDGIKWGWPKSRKQIRLLTPNHLKDKHGDDYMIHYRRTYLFKIELGLFGLSTVLVLWIDWLYYRSITSSLFWVIFFLSCILIYAIFIIVLEPFWFKRKIQQKVIEGNKP